MKPFLLPIYLCAINLSAVAHAEGGCPAGMIPYRGNDISSCAPIPTYNQNPNQERDGPRWITTWGAIAAGDGATGFATGIQNSGSAKKTALQKCNANGGKNCKVELVYRNQCAALVAGEKGHNSYGAATVEEATHLAMNFCERTGDTKCQVFYTGCSLPMQVE